MRTHTQSAGYVAAALALAAMTAPAQAQFGGLFRGSNSDDERTEDGCPEGSSQSTGSRVLGGIVGGIAGNLGRRVGIPIYVPVEGFADTLSSAIACRLDPEEQEQAAEATLEATRGTGEDGGAEVGQMAAWTSNTREDVSGTSTVTARDENPGDGLDCILVTDVVIVEGEEARADKRMCRRPPSPRYTIRA